MQGKSLITRVGIPILIAMGALVIFSTGFLNSFSQGASPIASNKISNTRIGYPFSTNICIDGCRAHQNWVSFYLASNTYVEKSLRLKTSLFWGQLLTYGISSTSCLDQVKPGYTCINMEISHRLLSLLTGLNLTSLDQLRNNSNWWLEYAIAGQANQ